MTKVSIISGFLGAGKTTFIKQLLAKVFQGQKVVLIENEFGEIGIDSGFLKNAGVEITEMNSGCICCTLVGDFSAALQKVVGQFHPDRILIEPSGVGKLSDVAAAVLDVPGEAGLELDGMITVVDAKKAKSYIRNFGEFFLNQVEHADTLVLSRTDAMSEAKLEECVHLLREHNSRAAMITTPWEQLTGEVLTDALGEQHRPAAWMEELIREHQEHEHEHEHHHHDHHDHEHHDHEHHDHDHHHHEHEHHHADEVFTSWGVETVHKFERAELETLLQRLAETDEFGSVLRAKGMVALTDGSWVEFDLVPEEREIRETTADIIGRICVIGVDLKEDMLKESF